jgi:hypothetical protein
MTERRSFWSGWRRWGSAVSAAAQFDKSQAADDLYDAHLADLEKEKDNGR